MAEQENIKTEAQAQETETNPFSKVAEYLNRQSNPLETPQFESFTAEPFFKEEEKIEDKPEPDNKGTETPATEEGKNDAPETKVEEPAKETNLAEEAREIPEYEFVSQFNDKAGTSFGSIAEITSAIEEYQNYKKAESEVLQLTQQDRARLEVGREFGDYTLYDRIMSIDTNKLSPKEALRQSYLLENEGSPQFLEMTFEREFKKAYEEDPDEEYSKHALENKSQLAIRKIKETQEAFKDLGQINGGVDPEEAKRAKAEEDDKWFQNVDNVLNKVDRLTYQIEDGPNLNIVMDAKDKKVIQANMDQPIEWLRREITDDSGKVDHEALMEIIFRHMYYEKALKEAYNLGAAAREEKLLKENKKISIETAKAGDPGHGSKPLDDLAKNFRSLISNY